MKRYSQIKIKQKKCKGNGSAKGYGCSETLWIHKYGLCYKCYVDWYHNSHESLSKRKSNSMRTKRKKTPALKNKKCNTYAQLVHSVRYPFQKLIRIRDMGQPCISCGAYMGSVHDYDAGHFISAESCSYLIFNAYNVNGQCRMCNQALNGNFEGYKKGLIAKIGQNRVAELFLHKKKFNIHKYDRFQLNRMKNYYEEQLRLVESEKISIEDVSFNI